MKIAHSVFTAILLICMDYQKSLACLNEQVESLSNIPKRLPSERSNYWSGGSDPVLNDEELVQQWYRVVHDGYQYLMVDSNNKPEQEYCSTYYPVYLKGTHPLVESLTETAQSFLACRRDYFYPCSVSYEIKIRRCGTEVQYYLSPTQNFNAFCFQVGEKVPPNDITTTLKQTTNADLLTFTTDKITTMMSSVQDTSTRGQLTREQTTVQQTTDTDSPIYTTYHTTTKLSSVQTTREPTTITTSNERTDTSTKQTSTIKNIQTSDLLGQTTFNFYETSVASTRKSTQVPWEQTTQSVRSTTKHETLYTSPLTTEERRTSKWEPEATDEITSGSHQTTTYKHGDGTGMTTEQQRVEKAVGDDTRKIIIILTVCMGFLVVTIIGLVVVIIRRKRKLKPRGIDENKVSDEAVADYGHKYDTPANIYQTIAERDSVANPYESLRYQNVREFGTNQSEYDVIKPDANYQTLDYDRMRKEDDHCYQTLPQ